MAKDRSSVVPYALDPGFERVVVFLACSRPRFYGLVGHALEPDALATEPARLAVRAAHLVAKDVGHGPDAAVLVIQRLRRLMSEGKVTIEQIVEVGDLLDAAEDAGLPPEESVVAELAPVIQRRQQMAAIAEAASAFGRHGDFSGVVGRLQDAERIGKADQSVGTILGDGVFEQLAGWRSMERLPTGIYELDAFLEGGMPRKQLGMWIADPGGGKSMALNHLAAESMRRGQSLAWATLELPVPLCVARLMANILELPIDYLLDAASHASARGRLQEQGGLGRCYVQEFTPQATTAEEVLSWVKRCEEDQGRAIDVVVVDYADKLISPKSKDTKGSGYLAGLYAYEALRIHAVENNCWCWTASQATRSSRESAKKIDLQHSADSMHKVRVADLVITLNQRDDRIVPFVAKNRTGPSRRALPEILPEWSLGRIGPLAPPPPAGAF